MNGRPEENRAAGVSAIKRLYDEALAREAVHAERPLQRYLAVVVAPR